MARHPWPWSILLLALAAVVLNMALCLAPAKDVGPPDSTPTIAVVVLPTRPETPIPDATLAALFPSPTAMPAQSPGASTPGVVVGETAPSTLTALATLTATPTSEPPTPTGTRTPMVQRG